MKKLILYVIFVLILIFGIVFWKNNFSNIQDKKIYTPNKIYTASIANNKEERELGLSNTTSLPPDMLKLFIFEQSDSYGFWMKDMNYPIDIVFLNENMEVVSFFDNVRPDSYPQVFYPESNSLYVLEMNTGERLVSGLDKGIKVYYK